MEAGTEVEATTWAPSAVVEAAAAAVGKSAEAVVADAEVEEASVAEAVTVKAEHRRSTLGNDTTCTANWPKRGCTLCATHRRDHRVSKGTGTGTGGLGGPRQANVVGLVSARATREGRTVLAIRDGFIAFGRAVDGLAHGRRCGRCWYVR